VSGSCTAPRVFTIEGPGSWRTRALNLALRLTSTSTLNSHADVAALRERYELLDARCFPLHRSVRREPVDCDGVPAQWVSVPQSLPGRTLLYLHGGSFAFRFPNAQTAFAARLCRQLRASALVPDYRLAPEHPYPAAPDDCERAWRWARAQGCQPAHTVFVGDSAGGTLSLVTLNRSLRNHEPLPACAVLLSPAVDCTLASPSLTDNHRFDAVISLPRLVALRQGYVPDPELYRHPDVSPYFADFTGFPPLFMQAGSTEMLRDEALRVADKAHTAGVDVQVELWPGVPHAFQLAPFLPETTRAIERITAFVAARTGWVS
jgi:monoterpene epsilon-lactone hydrolase